MNFGAILWSALGTVSVVLGLKGFSRRGLPFSSKKTLTGKPARVVGSLCILFGLLCYALMVVIIYFQSIRQQP